MRISDWSADVCSSDLQYLAPQQIQCLNAVAALVDRVQSIVSIELHDRVLAGVAIAAEYLNRQIVGRNAPLCRPRLAEREIGRAPCRVRVGEYGEISVG